MKMLTFSKCLAAFLAMALQITGAFGAILIDATPQNATIIDGKAVTLTVLASSDIGKTLTYQWYKLPGTLLSGKTTNKLTFSAAKSTDAGDYVVVITELGVTPPVTVTTDAATLTVNVRPVITVKPATYSSPILEGSPATYGVTLNSQGTPPFTYTWQRKVGKSYTTLVSIVGTEGAVPVVIDKATASILTSHTAQLALSDVRLADAGTYRVQVTNITGTVVSSPDFSLKVDSRPVILKEPTPESNLALGATKTLSVVVGGNKPLTYQWFKNNVAIPKSNSSTLKFKATAETPPSTPDVYRVEIFNPISPGYVTPETMTKTVSANANVHVIRKPVIATQPTSPSNMSTVVDPINHTLSVVMAPTTNPGTYTYQWQKDGKNIVDQNIVEGPDPRIISGAQTATLSLTPLSWLDRGSYRVIVKNEVGSITSKSATVALQSKPLIVRQSPAQVFGNVGGSIKLFVVAGGTPSKYQYTWFYRPKEGPGSDTFVTMPTKTATLTMSKLSVARDGDYKCVVTTTTGSVESAMITLKVDIAPKITTQTSVATPPPDGFSASSKVIRGGSVRLFVAATIGTNSVENPMKFRWQKNKKDLVGAPDSAILDLTSLELTATGNYRCIVSNYSGVATSKELAITVQNPPSITVQPQNVEQFEEIKLETLTVKATGAATLKYQWEKQYTLPVGGGTGWTKLTSQTASKLSIAKADATRDSGVYRCVVTNSVGTAISNEIVINVLPLPIAELGPVAGVSAEDLYPTVARTGEYVRIFGKYLSYTRSVKFGTASVTPVIESDNAILVKVPSGAPTTDTAIEVVSKNGSKLTSTPFRRTNEYENTFREWDVVFSFIRNSPTIILFSKTIKTYAGDNRLSTSFYGPVWYYFEVPVNYSLTARVTGLATGSLLFDPSIHLYEEEAGNTNFFLGPNGITKFKRNPSRSSQIIGNTTETVSIDSRSNNPLTKSRKFMLLVRGTTTPISGATTDSGKFTLSVAYNKLTSSASSISGTNGSVDSDAKKTASAQTEWQTEGEPLAVQTTEDQEIIIGGSGLNPSTSTVLWRSSSEAPTANTVTKTSFVATLSTGESEGDDLFSWQMTDSNGEPILAVWLSSSDGEVRLVQPDGSSVTLAEKLPLNSDRIPFEIVMNTVTKTWTLAINGNAVSEPLPLPSSAVYGGVSAVWDLGADGVASGASMIFRDFKVEQIPVQ